MVDVLSTTSAFFGVIVVTRGAAAAVEILRNLSVKSFTAKALEVPVDRLVGAANIANGGDVSPCTRCDPGFYVNPNLKP